MIDLTKFTIRTLERSLRRGAKTVERMARRESDKIARLCPVDQSGEPGREIADRAAWLAGIADMIGDCADALVEVRASLT